MKKTKTYRSARLDPEAIIDAKEVFESLLDEKVREDLKSFLSAQLGQELWEHDSQDEFFADIRRGANAYHYRRLCASHDFIVSYDFSGTRVVVALSQRHQVERVFEAIERHTERCQRPEPEDVPSGGPTVFIGHGRSPQWRDLKDHLQDQHGYVVEAYEIGSRAGHTIRDILEEMLSKTSMALLVMTGEDRTDDGAVRARQNVVHEVGLFQGRLGFSRAIVLLEEGTEEFSNLQGVQQIRFGHGRIRESFGDVLAVLRREFGDTDD